MQIAKLAGAGSLLPLANHVNTKNAQRLISESKPGRATKRPVKRKAARKPKTAKKQRIPAYARDIEAINGHGRPVRVMRVELSRADKAEAEGYARAAGMDLDVFMDAAFGNRAPFSRWDHPEGDFQGELTGSMVRFECSSPALLRRIERAATHYGRSFEQYIAEAVASSVQGDEGDMIRHPETGAVIASRDRLEEWQVKDEWIGVGEQLQLVTIALGAKAQAALEKMRLAFPAVPPVLFCRAALEADLRDAAAEPELAGTMAAEGQRIGQEKSSAAVWDSGRGIEPLVPVPGVLKEN